MMSAGDFSSCANARSAERSWPMMAAARAPRPSTSPMTMPTRPAASGMMSYQSPPTCVWIPWPWVSSGLAGTYRQATSSPSRSGMTCGSRLFWKARAVARSVSNSIELSMATATRLAIAPMRSRSAAS
jgi:hypothetical protein